MNIFKINSAGPFFLVFIVNVLATYDLCAQTTVAIGPKVGASFSGLRGDDAGNINMREGLVGGLFLNVSPWRFFSIQPEFLLQQKGAVNKNEDFNFREDVRVGYFVLPVLAKLRIPIKKTFFPHIYAGPQFSYAFKNSYSVNSLDTAVVNREINLRKYDLGGVFGLGLDVELNHLFITGDIRYGLGGINIGKNIDLKNTDISIMAGVGYIF